jgi:hypothetical protein
MTHAIASIRPAEVAALLDLSGVEALATSPLTPWLGGLDPSDTSEQQLLERGLLVEEDGRRRINSAIAVTLATLARPEETLTLHFADGSGEKEMVVARLKKYLVGLRPREDHLELLFPVGRAELVAAIHAGISGGSEASVEIDISVSPVGQFLMGVLARHHRGAPATSEQISASVDGDVLVHQRALGLAMQDPARLDAIFHNVRRVAAELGHLVQASVVSEEAGTYLLGTAISGVLGSEPTGSLTATRLFHGEGVGVGGDTITAIRFREALLLVRTVSTDRGPMVRIYTASHQQVAATVSALLFSDAELEALAP